MQLLYLLVLFSCAFCEGRVYPSRSAYGSVGTYAFRDPTRGGLAMSSYYNPYHSRAAGVSMAAFMIGESEEGPVDQQSSQYYKPERCRQNVEEANKVVSQQDEIFPPQQSENQDIIPTEATEIVESTEKIAEVPSTTAKVIVVPELVEPEIAEVSEEKPAPKPKKDPKKKPVKRPVVDDDDDEEEDYPRMPTGTFFPMFFGWGGRSGSGSPGGPTAIANAFSAGRGAAAASRAIAYEITKPEERV